MFFIHIGYDKKQPVVFVYRSHVEQHAGDFSVTVRDVRQLTQPESDLLTLLWVLEGSVNLAVAEGASQPLVADGLAIVNRNRRWSLRSAGANAVMILTLSASWLARLDNAFLPSITR